MRPRPAAARALWLALAVAPAAHAALEDEIQVYLDDINAPHEAGLELHVNATPAGRPQPDYPGEVVSRHGLRLTPEFSYGLAAAWEAGLYLPAVRDADGRVELAGVKLRLKWLPLHGAATRGWFAGANLELSRVAGRYAASRSAAELRLMGGRRGTDWTVGFNPAFSWALSDGERRAKPDLDLGLKLARRVAAGVALGAEYYAGVGALGEPTPWAAQDHRLYLALDLDRAPWIVNAGVGYGLSGGADRWTLKAIFEVPFGGARRP